MTDPTSALMDEYNRVGAAAFPGSHQVQGMRWSVASHAMNDHIRWNARSSRAFDSFFYTTVYHTEFAPEWPVTADWPAIIRGLRGSLHVSQSEFARICGLGRATVERWESGRMVPFRGDALQLLTLVRPHLESPVQAGQGLNLAAAAVLPQLTRPTAKYGGQEVAGMLKSAQHDHTDLGRALLDAMLSARILVAIDADGGDPLEDTYFPLAGRLSEPTDEPAWARELVRSAQSASDADRRLLIGLARRLSTGSY